MRFKWSRKSTIIAAVKDLLGLNLSESDLHKLKSATVNGQFECDNKKISCSNCNGKRLYDTGYDLDSIKYVDCDENIQIQEFNIRQANIEELLEQMRNMNYHQNRSVIFVI